jgi:hypothetical protein
VRLESRRGGWQRALALALFALAAVLVLLACRKKPDVGLEIDLPSAVSDQTKWIEVGVFGGTSCNGLAPLLPGGLPAEGAVARLAFDVTKGSPSLGDLAKAKYAFAAVARDVNCAVIAYGCADVDVSSATSVAITLQPAASAAGACPAGSACVAARCVPGNDNGDPAIGSDCSLQLVGSGPLGDPLVQNGGIVSPPAIAATPKGFLIAYREYDGFAGQSRVTTIVVDNGGGATAGPVTVLPDRCQQGEESDALGLAFQNDTTGLAVVSRAACSPKPAGIDLLVVDPTGSVASSGFEGQGEPRRILSPAHALAYDPKVGDYMLVFTENNEAQIVFPNGNHLENRSPISFGGPGQKTGAWVASTDRVRAFVAVGSGGDVVPDGGGGTDGAGDPDADADGGEAGPPPPPPPPPPEGGAPGSSVRLQVLQASEDVALVSARPPDDAFSGSWASVAAIGARVVVASDGLTAGKQVAFRVYEGGQQITSDGLLIEGSGKVTYTDMAMIGDRLFFAVEKSSPPSLGAISLYAYTSATTTPTFKRRVILPEDPRVPAMGAIRDGLLAVAASATRVAVVWGTGKTLTDKDAVGGYAVFACSGQ